MVNCATNEGLAQESVWYEKFRYEDAERQMFEQMAKQQGSSGAVSGSVVAEIMKARDHIKHSLAAVENVSAMVAAAGSPDLSSRLQKLEIEVAGLKKVTNDLSARLSDELRALVMGLDSRVKALEASKPAPAAPQPAKAPAAAPAPAPAAADDDDEDVDLFGSDEEEDEEAERIKAERVAAYAAKKSNKPVLIAKSSILLDVKPWDDETDMKEMERKVRTIEADGLLWAAQSKLVPLAYGIMKLQIGCVIEDDKISVDWLTETIQEFEDLVQSVDIAQFNKI